MNVGEMALIVVTIGQAIKELLREKFKIEGKASVILMVFVACGVVGYKFIVEQHPFDLAVFILLVSQVASIAIGGKLVGSSLAKKVNK